MVRFSSILAARSNRFRAIWWLLLAGLFALRLPSLAQPAGADQALYAYVGQRILAGDVPYRDAWDQKPPAVHVAYAAMFALWPHESAVAGADLIASGLTAWLLALAATRLTSSATAGFFTAALYLFLANPAYTRLGGVRIRAQCETFIGLLVAAAVVMLTIRLGRGGTAPVLRRREAILAGLFLGLAVVFKYNAAVYGLPVAVALVLAARQAGGGSGAWVRRLSGLAGWTACGAAVPVIVTVGAFAMAGALEDLYLATVTYNVRYSGETYASVWHMAQYLVTFPIGHARLDSLWMLGGAGTAVMLVASLRRPELAVVPAWIAATCMAIAINGSRGLPQYFVQAWPPLALAAGVGAAVVWPVLRPWGRVALVVLTLLAVPRVTEFPKMLSVTAIDARRLAGQIDERTYLGRFGRADSADKYSALAVHDLAALARTQTAQGDRIYVFGFSPWAYVGADRASASRFFWSRPVIIGFERLRPGYGVEGLLDELRRQPPRLVALQARDWDPDGPNSLDFFMAEPRLSAWLSAGYVPSGTLHNFQLWARAEAR